MTNIEAIPDDVYIESVLISIATEKLITELEKRLKGESMKYKLLGKKQFRVRIRTRVRGYSIAQGVKKSRARRAADWVKRLFMFSGGVSCFLFVSATLGFGPSQQVFYKVVGG